MTSSVSALSELGGEPAVADSDIHHERYRKLGRVLHFVFDERYEQFLRRFRVDFPTARDPEANISSNYGTFQIPETYLIDSTGKVREKIISNQNWVDPQFLDRVKTMLR